MIILIPMGGFGSRFADVGYKTNKPSILTHDRNNHKLLPMVVSAMHDMPSIFNTDTNIICVNRDFHQTDGTEDTIKEFFPNTNFVHDFVLLDQAFGCFLARDYLLKDDELFIGTCDNGFEMDQDFFDKMKKESDVIMFSHSQDENIVRNPSAHSWARVIEGSNLIEEVSIKKPVSEDYYYDHATTGMFWFKSSVTFLNMLSKMLQDRNSFDERLVLDNILNYFIKANFNVRYMDVKYLCWGTPVDYEEYQQTYTYWQEFFEDER
jgi:hypothetical protein